MHILLIYYKPQSFQEAFFTNTLFLDGSHCSALVLHVKKKWLWKNYHFVSIRCVLKHELSYYNCFGVLVKDIFVGPPCKPSRCARMAEHKSRPKTTKNVISGHDCCAN